MPGKHIREQEQAQILAEHASGDTPLFIAQRHGISEATVYRSIRKHRSLMTVDDTQSKHTAAVDISGMLTEYLRESFTTLIAQVQHLRDPDWLRRQDAAALGVTHGILFDKVVRVLRAASPPPDELAPGSDGGGAIEGERIPHR